MLQKHKARKEAKWYDHFRPKTQAQHMQQQDAMMLHLHNTTGQLLDQSALQLQLLELQIMSEGPAKAQARQHVQSRLAAFNACCQLKQQEKQQKLQQLQQEQLMHDMLQEQQQQYDELQRHGVAGNEDAGLFSQHACTYLS